MTLSGLRPGGAEGADDPFGPRITVHGSVGSINVAAGDLRAEQRIAETRTGGDDTTNQISGGTIHGSVLQGGSYGDVGDTSGKSSGDGD
ncbi:hypothetical protein AB0395_20505 [Streptosporangium sp. NPDC051023]|uniref:hypothetical protein n=1 Tax=Streptosporangium sp. NPDC051023 TaxID=3155410 RepID=UPI0034502B68